jgi:ABC-2 type transport system permease protein
MTLLGGAVFPIAVLPGWLQWLGRLMPIRFAYDGVRAALFSGSGWGLDAVVLLGFGAVGAPLGMMLFGRALAHAKRVGTISEY